VRVVSDDSTDENKRVWVWDTVGARMSSAASDNARWCFSNAANCRLCYGKITNGGPAQSSRDECTILQLLQKCVIALAAADKSSRKTDERGIQAVNASVILGGRRKEMGDYVIGREIWRSRNGDRGSGQACGQRSACHINFGPERPEHSPINSPGCFFIALPFLPLGALQYFKSMTLSPNQASNATETRDYCISNGGTSRLSAQRHSCHAVSEVSVVLGRPSTAGSTASSPRGQLCKYYKK
jgi:hypothetical protein